MTNESPSGCQTTSCVACWTWAVWPLHPKQHGRQYLKSVCTEVTIPVAKLKFVWRNNKYVFWLCHTTEACYYPPSQICMIKMSKYIKLGLKIMKKWAVFLALKCWGCVFSAVSVSNTTVIWKKPEAWTLCLAALLDMSRHVWATGARHQWQDGIFFFSLLCRVVGTEAKRGRAFGDDGFGMSLSHVLGPPKKSWTQKLWTV